MYTFIKKWSTNGTTFFPGVTLPKGNFIVTDTTISLKGSATFTNIPKEYLEPYKPTLPTYKKQVKVKVPKTLKQAKEKIIKDKIKKK